EVLPFDLPRERRSAAVEAALVPAHDLDAGERAVLRHDLLAALERASDERDTLHLHGRELPFCIAIGVSPEVFVRGRIDLVGAGASGGDWCCARSRRRGRRCGRVSHGLHRPRLVSRYCVSLRAALLSRASWRLPQPWTVG